MIFFFLYTATHKQVTRSAPSLEPSDTKIPYVNTKETKVSMSRHSQLRKGNKLKKANEEGDELVRLGYYNRRQKVVTTESSV